MLKNTVPLPLQPRSGASSAWCGATVLTRALRPTLHIPNSSFSLQHSTWVRSSGGPVHGAVAALLASRPGMHLLTPQSRGHALQSASSACAAASFAGMRPSRYKVTATGV